MNARMKSVGVTIGVVALGMGGVAFALGQTGGDDAAEAQGAAPAAAAAAPAGAAPAAAAAPTPGESPATTVVIDLPADQGGPGGDDDHHGDGDGDGDHRGRGPGGRGPGLDVIADGLGMTVDELFAATKDGTTIAALAEAKNIEPQTLVDAAYDAWLAREQAEVDAGDHTQAEIDARSAEVKDRLTAIVNGTLKPGDGPGHHGGKDGGHRGGHGDDDGDHQGGDQDGDNGDGDGPATSAP